jgi:hypothetical protein
MQVQDRRDTGKDRRDTVTGQEKYRYRAGEMQEQVRRDTGTGKERCRNKRGETQEQEERYR